MDNTLREGLDRLAAGNSHSRQVLEDHFDEKADLLNRYIEEIELFNPAYGLVGTEDRRELIVKHILDSLAPLGVISRLVENAEHPRLADAGSGAGLPGIPLAICLGRPFTLIERMGRRAGFLRSTLAVLGLNFVDVEEKDMEKAAPGRYNLVTFRAFKPLDGPLLKGLFRLLVPGGVLAAYKGRREKINEEMEAVKSFTGGWECFGTPVPFLDEERHLVVIRPGN